MQARTLLLSLFALAICLGCHHAPVQPTLQPATNPLAGKFASERFGFSLQYPSDWSPRESNEFVMLLLPNERSASNDPPTISMDVPKLPPHLPGMIRIPLIQNGFLDDLRRQFGSVEVVEERDIEFTKAKARLLELRWRDGEQIFRQRALLMIHGNRVYILRGTARDSDFAAVEQAFSNATNSLQWLPP